jgi:SAM-dependent methyltransferase
MDSEVARHRLYPRLTDPNYLALQSRCKIIRRWCGELNQQQVDVLDIGGRYQPYRPLLDGKVSRYIALDIIKADGVSVIADGQYLPFIPESFDIVIATGVFEFFKNPEVAAREIHSVLRPGGILIASVSTFAPRFTLGERWRFLPEGVQSVLASFQTIEVVPELYNFGGFFRLVNIGLSILFRSRGVRSIYRWTACPLLNVIGLSLENLGIESNDAMAPNYSIRAKK